MKNIILGSVLAIAAVTSLSANAATICSGAEAKNGEQVVSNATGFVKVAFTLKCSANVFLDGVDQSSTVYAVAAGSGKGKNIFAGTTEGGAVNPVVGNECPSSGCTAALVTAQVPAAAGS
jgi:hypothetical protein